MGASGAGRGARRSRPVGVDGRCRGAVGGVDGAGRAAASLAPRGELVGELVAAGGESLGVADERHDDEHAADDHEDVAAEVDPLGGEVEDDAAGGDDARLDAAEDRGDAGEVRGGHEGETEERGEALPGDDALAVGEQAAGDARR